MKISTITAIAVGVLGAIAGGLYLATNKGAETETAETNTEVETESTEAPTEA